MKLPFGKSAQRFLLWGVGMSALHLAATFALRSAMEEIHGFLSSSSIPAFLIDERIHVVRELVLAGTILLHLPAAIAEIWGWSPSRSIDVWWIFAGDALLYGFGVATLFHWLNRPPRIFSRYALPLVSRQMMTWTMLLAAAHMVLSAVLYFGFRFATVASGLQSAWVAASTMLVGLHPWLLAGGLRPYGAAEPQVIAVAVFDALAWGFVTAWLLAACLRLCRRR